MAYDGKVTRRARERFEADRDARRKLWEARREDIFRRQPRLREIDSQLRSTAGRIVTAALRHGTDPGPAIERLKEENLRLQEEKRALLRGLSLPETALDERPACAVCGDSGILPGGGMCRCLRDYCARVQQEDLSRMLDLGGQSFEAFSLHWYSNRYDPDKGKSPRQNMERILRDCRSFARGFGRRGGNLLLCGAPGLGKTFLSAAIAREVSGAGFSVVYDTAGHVFDRFDARKFQRDEDAADDVNRVLRCDLFILDDLGAEMTLDSVREALYEIVNTRLLERRSTVINTNLGLKEIARRYSPQIASRLDGYYQVLPFIGEDIRRQKKNAGQG